MEPPKEEKQSDVLPESVGFVVMGGGGGGGGAAAGGGALSSLSALAA